MNMMGRTSRVPFRRRRESRRGWIAAALGGAIVLSVFVIGDRMAGRYQRSVLDDWRAAKEKLERMTMQYLRADIQDVRHTPDGKYRVTIYMENVYPEFEMHVMIPVVRVLAQSGPQWKEVESMDPPDAVYSPGNVVNLKERIVFDRQFSVPSGGDYFELLPGFFHVQFSSPMLVSHSAQPKDDVAERTDTYYIHLRPVGADLAAIRAKNQFPGEIPIYVPMPPH
ncbi:MAG: ABC transporter [Alphaproteobacteria bacterium]|nr:ABC transporter [Alphaproteobacteria bacterium]